MAEFPSCASTYGSTPNYAGVLELHGHGELGIELRSLAHAGRWNDMRELVDDTLVDAVAVVGEPDSIVAEVRRRHRGVASRVALYAPDGFDEDAPEGIAGGFGVQA